MARLKQLWIGIRTSFWFIPTIINILLIFVAFSVVQIDRYLLSVKEKLPFKVLTFAEEPVRTFLATIAGSMMTIAGVVFSITILVLAQTAYQYTSRVLRNFMRRKTNQVILGLFVGIFIFCLFLITNLHPTDNSLTAITAFFLALAGVGFLIYYIHQTSISIQATEILRGIQEETSIGIDALYPEPVEDKEPPKVTFDLKHRVYSKESGYIQAINADALVQLAIDYNCKIEVMKKIGDFVAADERICLIENDCIQDEMFSSRLYRSLIIGHYRTSEQDVAYGIQQITDIVLRALASGTNDLSTAQAGIDYIKCLYIQLANRKLDSSLHEWDGQPWLIIPIYTFESLVEIGLEAICANAKDQPVLTKRINETIRVIEDITHSPSRKAVLSGYICEEQSKP